MIGVLSIAVWRRLAPHEKGVCNPCGFPGKENLNGLIDRRSQMASSS